MKMVSFSAKTVGFALLLASGVPAQLHREQRGLLDDILGDLSAGIGSIGVSARHDFQKFGQEFRPAMEQMNQAFGNIAGEVVRNTGNVIRNNPLFQVDNMDRVGEVEEYPSLSHSSGPASEQSPNPMAGIPGLHNLFGGDQSLDPFAIFGLSRRRWYDGPNVCVDRKVLDETETDSDKETIDTTPILMDMTMTSCKDGPNYHECTTRANTNGRKKTVVVRHECCYGYTRVPGELGCSGLVMKPLEETIAELDSAEFMELIDTTGMNDMLKENITVFVPSDDAIEDFRHDLEKLNSLDHDQVSYNVDDGLIEVVSRKKRQEQPEEITIVDAPSLEDIVKGHMVEGFLDSGDMTDENLIDTLAQSENKLRINVYNTYPERVVMANCAKVTSKDHYTTNGVVHTVDKVILPATQTIAKIIATDVQFRSLANALSEAGLMETLDDPGQFTFFAPTETAFEQLDSKTKEKINAGNGCSHDILTNHILGNVICSGVIESKAKSVNILKKYLQLERDDNDDIFVEGKKLLMRDIIATNGVIHVVEEVLIPETARSVEEALETKGSTTLKELFELAGMNEDMDTFANKTIFAPSEKALKAMPKALMDDLKSDPERLKEFLMYHVAEPKTCKCDFEDNKLMKTGVKEKKLRLNTYGQINLNLFELPRRINTVQCARIIQLDDEVCGGMIHTVEKVLLPPGGKTLEIMQDSGRFEKFLELVDVAGLAESLEAEGPFTIMAPTDEAFEYMKDEEKSMLFEDKDLAAETVKHHIIDDMVCCAGIPRHVPFLDMSGRRTEAGDVISLRRSNGGHIYAERAEVTTCDMVADNGVVHAIDRVLRTEDVSEDAEVVQKRTNPNNSPFLLFKLFK